MGAARHPPGRAGRPHQPGRLPPQTGTITQPHDAGETNGPAEPQLALEADATGKPEEEV
ncbi:hypothetical protein [Hymenobacter aquaticus]|uniref:hypothetical protein n=1 Tax=Hymenobacter aquaticus TaxID=1867101 RepID=UPI0014366E02|nr:hypothetical protein [Hymenobacter aquaticus]